MVIEKKMNTFQSICKARGKTISATDDKLKMDIETPDEDLDDQRGDKRAMKSIKQRVPDHLLPKVVIVGRPNVGKSALFNWLVGGNVAIFLDEPGVTRDCLYGRSFWGENKFMVVDSGGVITFLKYPSVRTDGLSLTRGRSEDDIVYAAKEAIATRLPSMIEKQVAAAVEEAPVIIFLVDGQT